MIKQEFIEEIRAPLKNYGFHKKGAYWFKKCNDIIFCVNVQGSQWNKDNYYFEIGGAEYKESCPTPTLMHWLFRHRCKSNSGELNIPPQAALSCVSDLLDDLTCLDQLEKFLRSRQDLCTFQFAQLIVHYRESVSRISENKKETHYHMIVSLLQINVDLCHSMRNRTFSPSDLEIKR